MFTGIIEEIGVVSGAGRDRLTFEAVKVLDGMQEGDSIAVNGACLTVVSLEKRGFSANIMAETLSRTSLGGLRRNDRVNLERALALGGRIGGHLVLGHVDDTGEVMDIRGEEGGQVMRISAPAKLMPYIVEKGSIAVDGVSLTVAAFEAFSFSVSLAPYTVENTTLGVRRPGDVVNLETDIIAKCIERLSERSRSELTFEFLSQYGFTGGTDAG